MSDGNRYNGPIEWNFITIFILNVNELKINIILNFQFCRVQLLNSNLNFRNYNSIYFLRSKNSLTIY
jgi:hypothetical protein